MNLPGIAELQPLVKNWWMMAGRGLLALLLGICMMLWRVPTFEAIIVPFAIYALTDGLLAIASVFRAARPPMAGWPIALSGVVSVVLGALALGWPFLTPHAIRVLVAWGVLTGVLEIVAAMQFPRERAAHWLFGTGGASSVFLALLVLGLPQAGSDQIARVLSGYALVFGIVVFLAALQFRAASRKHHASE